MTTGAVRLPLIERREAYSPPVIGRRCNEPLLFDDGPARCAVRAYTTHSHHDDYTRAEAIARGHATSGECVTAAHHSRSFHKAVCLDGWANA